MRISCDINISQLWWENVLFKHFLHFVTAQPKHIYYKISSGVDGGSRCRVCTHTLLRSIIKPMRVKGKIVNLSLAGNEKDYWGSVHLIAWVESRQKLPVKLLKIVDIILNKGPIVEPELVLSLATDCGQLTWLNDWLGWFSV